MRGTCQYCRMRRATTKDHVVPRSYCRSRGVPSAGLTVACCEACNFFKADKPLHKWIGPVKLSLLRLRVGELAWSLSLGFFRERREGRR